ncbi:choriogenin Hminor [Ophiostoma piceae UAMH 11346]|uniref:Choriogenin Hminor n=1 Tax=Ophiostoma piceae (strain UAMH 11346) TaxID=1262450 RepID=S3BZ53_OPHP1|nr:choriogenin Hminor [Ophiostoma piceae UAMH 11346]
MPDRTETPPPNYDDLQSSDQEPTSSAPATPSSLPPHPPASDSNQSVDASPVSQPDVQSSLPPTLPPISVSEDDNQPETGESKMFFFTSSAQPKVSKVDSAQPPATLKKTRGRPQDKPRQNIISMPLHLKKLQPSNLLPSVHDLPRGRSVSAQPPVSVDSTYSADTAVHPPVPQVPAVSPALQDEQQPHHQHNQSLGNEASVTVGLSSRSQTSNSSEDGASLSPTSATPRSDRRKSWLPGLGGSRLRSKSHEPSTGPRSEAWVLSPDTHADYNVDFLINCEKVPELWDDNGGLYVYLSSPHSGNGASFKVQPSIIEQSRVLSSLAQIQMSSPTSSRSRARSFGGRDSLTADDAHRINSPPTSPPLLSSNESRLYLPVGCGADGKPELERLIALRNLFALLTGQPLVATHSYPTVYAVLLQVAELLHEFEFGFATGSDNSFGDAVDISTVFYVDQNGLSDVRFNREKTIEALVLGEQLRFWPLYNEAFCHAVGKYPALRDLKNSPLWAKISPNTLQRLERAHLDLMNRQHSVNTRLEQFDFPSLFAGVANSTSNIEYRNLRFKNWRASFSDMRAFVLRFYKTQFGSWPPKASSRRNPFSESGLNRLVLKTMYADLCSVYDLLANRNSLTTRAGEDGSAQPITGPSSTATAPLPTSEASVLALRQILSEFDQSSPPVLPPVPFDTPKLPTMASLSEKFTEMSPKDQARFQRNVHSADLQTIMTKSHNPDAERPYESPFLAAFEAFELREAKNHKTETELTEMRTGHWLFLYVVLQSMPMLVIDAPGLQYTEGVEYFLCEPPQGRAPWVEDAGEVRKAWFQTAGGAGPLVELSADVLLYSVEATYHRSHCWLAAKKWESERAVLSQPVAAAVGMSYTMQPAASMGSMPSITSMRNGSVGGSTFVTLPDLPIGSINSGGSGGSAGSASAMGLASPVSLSNPSLTTLATMVSATDSSATANGSNNSSPRILPTLNNEGTILADYELARPSSSSPALGPRRPSQTQYSPTLVPVNQMGQPVPALSLPQQPQTPPQFPQRRENYQQLQERATLRHASIGWALEPVSLESVQHQQGDFQKPIPAPFANTRRIASAGNLRVMTDTSGNANYAAHNGQRKGSASAASPGGLTVPGVTFNSESTFDSILNSIDADSSKKSKKRSSFLPFM